ncbi:MAG TPA: class I SAM-dependent methyltransferase [Anaerolineae bacterium]|nr:class I SAM-dependent methyltransferase [Anaerolineae bacterium]
MNSITMDDTRIEAFAERLANEINASLSCLNLWLGLKLGLLQELHAQGAATPRELEERTGCVERYVREWLECMYAGEYLDYDASTGRFSLPIEHAAVLLDETHPFYSGASMFGIPALAGILPMLADAFQRGGGVPYEAYGDAMRECISKGNRPAFVNDYASKWIPVLPDVQTKLRGGARVADIGCGEGWSSIALAQAFPNVHIDAVDIDAASIEAAKRNAHAQGVADRVLFHLASADYQPLTGSYALVTAFECLHDMAYPVQALKMMRELASPNGVVFIADEAANDSLEENRNFLGHYFYNWSVLHCLPQAMVFPDATGTGTVMRPSIVRDYASQAGFTNVQVLPIENPSWRFYRLTP